MRSLPGGHSFVGYIENVSRDFFAEFNEQERQVVLADGWKWPSSALAVLTKLPENPGPEIVGQLENLDRQLRGNNTEPARRLKIGIVAILGAVGGDRAMAYLREIFENEPDRRVPVAMGLAQRPEGENWPLLVRSLNVVEGSAAQEVMRKLLLVEQAPDRPEPYRQVILRGLLLREKGSQDAVALLEKWTSQQLSQPGDDWQTPMEAWQNWFVQTYPDEPEPKLPVDSQQNNWTYQELLSFLSGPQSAQGDPNRGAVIFEKAQCIKCHRRGERGEILGPDLTTVSQRFQKKEILESILYPSQVISDQYAAQTIVTKDGRTITGMVAPTGNGGLLVLQSNGEKAVVTPDNIEERSRSKQSAMPEGLLNSLTLEEIADLFSYLTQSPTDLTSRPLPPRR